MEKAILKTLAYSDIFDYPLKAWEIHKWLISRKGSLRQIEKALKILNQESRIKNQGNYYFLPNRETLVRKRLSRQRQSIKYLRVAKLISQLFKLIPWIKLVGISGSLSMENSIKLDDIDIIIITSKKRLWLSRIFLLGIVEFIGKRRKKEENLRKVSGKICINILLEEDSLAQQNKNIYLAHEVLQMRVLWQRDGIYQKYLESNDWAFKYLPNWKSSMELSKNSKLKTQNYNSNLKTLKIIFDTCDLTFDIFEKIAKFFQLRYMGKPKGMEKISSSALYFHPEDNGPKVLYNYQQKLARLKIK